MPAQSVIVPLASQHARFMTLRFASGSNAHLKAAIGALLDACEALRQQYPQANIKTGIAFGLAQWQQLYAHSPEHWHDLQARAGDFAMPAIAADVFLHIASEQADVCFALVQAFMQACGDVVTVLNETTGFRYLDSRDLTGFIDGTENPQQADERAQAALLTEDAGEFAEGSFVMAQRYVHHMKTWHEQSIDSQEKIIGRTKPDSIELDDAVRPANSHISRVIIEDDTGEELAILRHSLPYGNASGEQGLYFIAYTPDLGILDAMLDNMFGTSGDGLHDQFLHYTTPVDGAYFFMPSEQLLAKIIA
ncbi:Dyp-type peroxidase [Vitreoscilla stercoraria]|uniref:Dyp-type peroxidase n=1 Tax=Vitreoscilla stercoraria TaxID=61 RepID=A0ABY4EDJ9_VITST|nr:Dyp-type peroxidase [Vitreoscilla stercoraria]UOO93449.1 Dyp-type peroxidase [Vitreoscilla stercoraria]